jgi:hypothetical protein
LEVVGGGGEEGAMLLRLTDAGDDAVQRHAAS